MDMTTATIESRAVAIDIRLGDTVRLFVPPGCRGEVVEIDGDVLHLACD
jgi:hypothetical protein